jgi:hypothetical protein
MNKDISSKLYDAMFAILYIVLFPLQMLPSFAITFLSMASPLFWVFMAIGVLAMIVQFMKFPCFMVRVWNSGMIALVMASLFMKCL